MKYLYFNYEEVLRQCVIKYGMSGYAEMRAPSHQGTSNFLSAHSEYNTSPLAPVSDTSTTTIVVAQDFIHISLSQDKDSSQDDDFNIIIYLKIVI